MSGTIAPDLVPALRARFRVVAAERDLLANTIAASVLRGRDPVSYAKALQTYGHLTAEYERLVLKMHAAGATPDD